MNENRVLQRLREHAAAAPKKIVFPESQDPRVVEAAQLIQERGLAIPILIGDRDDVPESIQSIGSDDPKLVERCAKRLHQNRQHKGMSNQDAILAIKNDSLMFAATLVAEGEADGAVAGSMATTANVIRAGLYGIGTAPGTRLISSFFLMQFQDRCLTYADCGVVPDQTRNNSQKSRSLRQKVTSN